MELAPSKFNCAVFGWDWDWETQDERNLWSIWGRRHKSTAESCRGKQWNRTGEGRGKCWAGIQDRLNILRTNKQHLRAAVRTKSQTRENSHIHLYPSHFVLHTVGTLLTAPQSLPHFYGKLPSLSFVHSQNGVKPNLTVSSSGQVLQSFAKQAVTVRQQEPCGQARCVLLVKDSTSQDFALSGKFSAFQNNPFSSNRCSLILSSQFSIGSSLSTALQRLSENKT